MSETFKKVEPLTTGDMGDIVVAKYFAPDRVGICGIWFYYKQARALRDWLNKALGEPHE